MMTPCKLCNVRPAAARYLRDHQSMQRGEVVVVDSSALLPNARLNLDLACCVSGYQYIVISAARMADLMLCRGSKVTPSLSCCSAVSK